MESINHPHTSPIPTAFFSLVNNPVKFRLFLLTKLPAAYFAGLKVHSLSPEACTVTVPLKWFTQNPFRSIYFACLSMAAELSTGVLAMASIYGQKPAVSMLVTGLEAKFYKKAVEKITFTCKDGQAIEEAVALAKATGEGQTVTVHSSGQNKLGETVAEFHFTWSFKAKRNT
ncbi:MAG: hypothetical protein JWP88_1409 [Flaviaesturariibacter sp.]|nr:hypothetical protein [Flaviaesturariibacter sp.]